MYCKNCGTPLDDNDVFCANCGTPREDEIQSAQEKDSINNSTIILVAAIVIVVMIAATIGTVIHLKSGADTGSQNAVNACINTVYSYFPL